MGTQTQSPIAVIGIGCRFPGAYGPAEFWRRLCDGYDGVSAPPPGRAEISGANKAGFLTNVDKFDPDFFGISRREARSMDPQLRMLLQTTWEALEDAGQRPADLEGSRTAVFMGQIASEYGELFARTFAVDRYAGLSNIRGMLSGRLSHVFDWSGPSVTVDTACSSSLMAVRLACQSLSSGESGVAVAGGVNLLLVRKDFPWLFRAGVLTEDGRCKFGDVAADGYVRGEGVGVVVLKPLDRAIADGDRVYAVIRGMAANNDGLASGSTFRPAVRGQADVIREALLNADVKPAEIDYVEAHGTGTAVGDVVELEALGAVLSEGRHERFQIGSVKTNIGHGEGVAGITGFIKATLCLHHGLVPPSLHLRELNPLVDWDELPLTIQTSLSPLPDRDRPRLAGVSSFGLSGTNVHAVLAEADKQHSAPDTRSPYLLTLSAATPEGLKTLAGTYTEYLKQTGFALRDICYSASVRRQHHPIRLAVTGNSRDELVAKLQSFVDGPGARQLCPDPPQGVVFVFPGQGSQWVGMGRELLTSSPVFAATMAECDHAVRHETGWSVLEKLAMDVPLTEVDVLQPVLFSVQVAIAAVWRSWGVEPELMIGHSMGEIAAACVASALCLEDAVAVICRRSRLAAQVAGNGVMASVALSVEEASTELAGYSDRVSVAASNSPATTLLSGDPDALAEIVAALERRDVYCRWVDVPFAAHSPQVDSLREDLLHSLAGLGPKPADVVIHSTVLSQDVDGSGFDAEYWVRNFREPVRFAQAVRDTGARKRMLYIEISPHPVLLPALEECMESYGVGGSAVGSLRRGQPELPALLAALGFLYTSGHPVRWERLYGPEARLVSLPTYPWSRDSYWITPQESSAHPLLGKEITSSATERIWAGPLDRARNRYLDDHRVQGVITFPGTGYCELALAAVRAVFGDRPVLLEEVDFRQLLILGETESPTLRVHMTAEPDCAWRIEVHSSADDGSSMLHTSGRVRVLPAAQRDCGEPLAAIRARNAEHLSGQEFYTRFAVGDNEWREPFRGVAEVWRRDGEALARVVCPSSLAFDDFFFHPALLDACGHALLATAGPVGEPFVLESFTHSRVWGKPSRELWSHARLTEASDGVSLTGDIRILDADGSCVAEVCGARIRYLGDSGQRLGFDNWLYDLRWEKKEILPATAVSGTWVILRDSQGVGHDLSQWIESAGGHCVLLDPGDVEAFDRIPEDTAGIVHLWSLDIPEGSACPEDAAGAEMLAGTSALRLVQSLTGRSMRPRLWLVTRNAHAVSSSDLAVSPLPSMLWGIGRVLTQEHPELQPVLVDLDATDRSQVAGGLAGELTAQDGENQLALRRSGRFVARMTRHRGKAQVVPRVTGPFQVVVGEDVTVEQITRVAPAADEVEIATAFAGVDRAGAECVGTVTALGAMSHGIHLGDRVVAVGQLGLRSHVLAKAPLVLKLPRSLDLADAATVPVAFLTAYHSLVHLASLRRGERVLIHEATDAVGMAAIQIARWMGAEILATADDRGKRALLRTMGIKHVVDSGSPGFAEAFLTATYGKGVDVVLNTLAGDVTGENLELLAPNGRYIELAHQDRMALGALARNISFHGVDVTDMWHTQPDHVVEVLREVFCLMDTGVLAPLPAQAFAATDAAEAFQRVARRIGKVLLSFDVPVSDGVRADSTYLVTGGMGGIGQEVVQWLRAKGAQHILLIGRSELSPNSPGLPGVRYLRADVASERAVRMALAHIAEDGWPPVRGVFHTAGVVQYGLIGQLSPDQFTEVLRPKVTGSLVLDNVFRGTELDYFVLFSSIAALVSSPMLASYAAANNVLDGLAHHRRLRGDKATSVNWGFWDAIGMADLADPKAHRLIPKGMGHFQPAEGIAVLERLLAEDVSQVAVIVADWAEWGRGHPDMARLPLLSHLVVPPTPVAAVMKPGTERSTVHQYLVDRIAEALEVPPESVNSRQPLNRMGLDSLAAVELKNLAARDLGVLLPVVKLLGGFTLDDLVDQAFADTP
jgi:acyl transferase domain-containing protein/NADPH:quinone reductase-like Zn-dependent oxidoreductase